MTVASQASLIGVQDWDPTGESMFLITGKLSVWNHFNHREAMKILGNKGIATLDAWDRRNPDNRTTIDTAAIEKMSGWGQGQLDASFSDFYFPRINVSVADKHPLVPLHSRIRICLECAAEGVHLVLHQLEDCACCPIHRTALTMHCPNCSERLERYFYWNFEQTPLKCQDCGWQGWDLSNRPSKKSIDMRLNLIRELRDWINTMQSVIDGADESRFFLSEPALFQNLANVHTLIPGPEWIEGCLVDSKRIKTGTNRFNVPLPKQSKKAHSNFLQPMNKSCFLSTVPAQAQTRVLQDISILMKEYDSNMENLYPGLSVDGGVRLRFWAEESTSVGCTGYEVWRSWATRFLPESKRKTLYSDLPGFTDEYFWAQWAEGPGKLFSSYGGISAEVDELCQKISSLWEQSIIRDWLMLYTVRAGIYREKAFIRHDEYSLEPVKMGGSPVIVVEKKPNSVHVKRATTLDKYETIRNYVSNLEVGFPLRAFDEVNSYDELFRLAGIRNHDQVVCLHQAKLRSTAKKNGLSFYPDIDHPSPWG